MKWEAGQDFIDRLRFGVISKDKYRRFRAGVRIALGGAKSSDYRDICATHGIYGKIYYPFYNLSAQMGGGRESPFITSLARN